jgi:hypothetical protein
VSDTRPHELAGAAKILIDPFLSDNPSWDKGWIGLPCRRELDTREVTDEGDCGAGLHLLDTGRFALEEEVVRIGSLMHEFLDRTIDKK